LEPGQETEIDIQVTKPRLSETTSFSAALELTQPITATIPIAIIVSPAFDWRLCQSTATVRGVAGATVSHSIEFEFRDEEMPDLALHPTEVAKTIQLPATGTGDWTNYDRCSDL
jgi:hypothetical protein